MQEISPVVMQDGPFLFFRLYLLVGKLLYPYINLSNPNFDRAIRIELVTRASNIGCFLAQ